MLDQGGFPDRPVHARHLLVSCGLVLGMVLAITVVLLLVQQRSVDIANTERELKNLALVLAEEADRSRQAAEAIQTSIVDHVRLHRIVRAIATLAAERGIATTAEGVETRQQLEALADIKCTEVQGYFFSPAVPAGEVTVLLAQPDGRTPRASDGLVMTSSQNATFS